MNDIIYGKLPDLFTFNDGKKVETISDWQLRRKEISDLAIDMCYGGMPPEPEYFDVEALCDEDDVMCYKVTAGTNAK